MPAVSSSQKLNKLELLRLMAESREGDRREGILLRQSKGWFQVSGMGHEALAALTLLLREDDYLFPYYRDRGLMLGRGLSTYEMALAYFGKKDSSSGGRQMPGHYSCRERNVFSVCTPTGGSLLPACGTAWGMKMQGTDSVCLATVGDAASRQGEYFEAVAFARQENLPLVLIVEDNKYGISTPTEKFLPFHLGLFDESTVVKLDGRHIDQVYSVGKEAISKARSGGGPTLIWCDLDRLSSHTSSDDQRIYRTKEDLAEMADRDPIRLLTEELFESGALTEKQWSDIQDEIVREVDAAYLKAEKQADPEPSDTMTFAMSEAPEALAPPMNHGRRTMVSAVNHVFKKGLEADPHFIFFGEDIEDPKGGVFGLTKGLSENFPKQVFNSPLAEATIMGVAVGLSIYGFKPVFELQFIDFMLPGWNQIVTNMSTLEWRSYGEWKTPIVVYTPYGAYLPGGSLWHSQSNEAMLAHVPGIRIAIPSTPEDAAGLMWTAMHGEGTSFVLIPKHVFRKNVEPTAAGAVPFGKARVVQEGSDITLVTFGNCVELAQEAMAQSDRSVELIDLRSIVPCDYDTIVKSLEKTGRLIVLHEDTRTCGFGQCVISEITSSPDRFGLLLSAPQLVCREDVHVGFNPIYEYAALPDVGQVLTAIETVME